MLKFKYSPTYNKKNTSIISHLVKNELFKYSLLKNDELNLYNSFILENENNSNNISYVKNDLIENFILNYIISFESIIRNNELSIHDIECQINKFINNVSEKTIYFKNLSVDNIINHLYLKNKKDVLNIILKIVLKNGLVFKDLLLEKTKNKILENFFDYDYLPNSLDLLKGIESEVEISKNKLMKEKKEMFNNDVNKCENLSSLIKMEIENIDMQKMTNRNIESICSLKDNLLLINLINEKNKFNKIIQLKDEELVKKRI